MHRARHGTLNQTCPADRVSARAAGTLAVLARCLALRAGFTDHPGWTGVLVLCSRVLCPLALWSLLLLPAGGRAADDGLAALPEVRRAVTDVTGTLLPADIAAIEALIAAIERKKGSQIIVVLVPSTQPEPIEAYSIRLAERVKPGRRKVDDGLIILLAMNDRTARIEVGYGLEGVIPDSVADRVRREILNPRFRAGDYAGGLKAGVSALGALIEGESLPAPRPADHRFDEDELGQWWLPALFILFVLGRVFTLMLGRVRGSAAVGVLAGGCVLGLGYPVMLALLALLGGFVLSILLSGTRAAGAGPIGGFGGGFRDGGWGGGFGGSGGGWSGGGGFGGGGSGGSWH